VLLRVMVGGAGDPDAVQLDDEALLRLVRRELALTMALDLDPDFVHIVRHRVGIPQYRIGHLETLRRIEHRLEAHPGLYISGSSYRGVSLNSCIAEAEVLAPRILADLARRSPAAPSAA
jgi:oxygen-dependent protoporphyrinogen oxidase